MKSLSYIIFLMSLIGSSQSTGVLCTQFKNNFCSENKVEKISVKEAKQLIKKFNHFISKYNQKVKKQSIFSDSNFILESIVLNQIFQQNQSFRIFKLQQKTSKVRNKDYLDQLVLI